ncbi:MAG: sulfatase [Planctomycetaceae bacterium]|jgi:choline-sulfatase|nr:sulfatase [Planctomycetaceae bacterium]
MKKLILLSVMFALIVPAFAAEVKPQKPNVLFIAIDDMRDWTGYFGTHPNTKTPNLDRLASQGVAFTRSYCAAPLCNPSRAALLSGLRPSNTGVYTNNDDWRKIIPPEIVTLQTHFQQNGYETLGSGKIYHGSFPAETGWDDYLVINRKLINNSTKPAGQAANEDDDQYRDGVGGIKFQPLDNTDEEMEDYHIVQYGIDQLRKKHDKPFFLAVGLHKPHMPWNVPKKYYDLHPLDEITLPEVPSEDLDDVPAAGIKIAKPEGDHAKILESGRWKHAVQGYLAAISFSDAMVGRLLDALDKSEYHENTIVVLWSDHGWHLGEKQHWRKFALWEEANRQPLIWRVPGVTPTGVKTETPVDLMHVYPTLCDLTGLPLPAHPLDGKSIRPLLEHPESKADTAAVSTYGYQNHTVRTKDWRYIRYADGSEELYDEKADPHEWTNLASKPELAGVKEKLAKDLPEKNLPAQQKKEVQSNNRKKNNQQKSGNSKTTSA